MALGDLVVKMSADVAQLQSDLGKAVGLAEKTGSRITSALKGIGIGISIAGITSFIKGAIDASDALNDLRTRTGLTGQELLVLQGAAVRSGVGMEEVGDITSKLTRRLGEAAKGTGDVAAAYQAMGIQIKDASGNIKNQGQILAEVGAKLAGYENGANKGILAIAALGKGGDRLIPMLESIKETEERFKRLGIVISEDLLTQADKFNDTLEDLKALSAQTGRQIASALLPHLQQLVDAMIEFKKSGGDAGEIVNALIGPVKVLATGFLTLFTAVASSGEALAGFAAAVTEIGKGNFKNAFDELDLAGKRIEQRWSGLSKTVTALFQDVPKVEGAAKPKRGEAPGLPDLAALKAAEDALAKLQEQRTKNALDLLKDAGKQEAALLDARYANNLIGEEEYWKRKGAIQRAALNDEFRVLDEQIKRQQEAVNKESAKGKGSKDYYEALGKLEDSLIKRNKLIAEGASQEDLASIAASASHRKYSDEIEGLRIQLLELQGETAKAADLRQELTTRDLGRKIAANRDEESERLLLSVNALVKAQARFNEQREQQDQISTRLGITEERIQNSLRVGAISELDALYKTEEARKATVAQLESIVQAQEEIARASKNPALILQAEQARAALERLRAESELLADKFNTIFKDSFSDAFSDFISGTKSAKEAFNSFANSVVQQINKIVSQSLATQLTNSLGLGGSGPGGGLGGALASLFTGGGGGLFGGLFGKSAGLSAIGAATGVGASDFAAQASQLPGLVGFFDKGTDYVPRTGLAVVHQGEQIIPAGQGGGTNVVMNIYTPDANSFRASEAQISRRITEIGDRAKRRNR